ncbi:MAG TPA: hypothetical protein VH597_15110 [Verrucomicrobiae bacterium]|jgi:hypothetical protein|nr:hypothetical protein [Verrucomicrobiae bacterium]
MHEFAEPGAKAVTAALKRLLTEKHLYQYVEVDTSFLAQIAKQVGPKYGRPLTSTSPGTPLTARQGIAFNHGASVMAGGWMPTEWGDGDIKFDLPTINTYCDKCQSSPPFNPVADESYVVPHSSQNQAYLFSYQCQQCKGSPVRFLVRREGYKLRLTGRDPLEVLPTPKALPKAVSKFYSNALIAHHAGQTLAGLFFLRVFIEQFWRQIQAVKELLNKDSRATGERQGDAYQSTLPDDFKSRFPSLKDVYGQLSAALHAAEANEKLFDESSVKIVEHFEARRLFKV